MTKINLILIGILLVLVAVFGFIYTRQSRLGISLPIQQNIETAGTVKTINMLSATSTSQSPSGHATSSALLIAGARKVTFLFAANATSTTKSVDFTIWASTDVGLPGGQSPSSNYSSYKRFNDLVPSSTTTPNLYTYNHNYSRYGMISVADGATTTASMDLVYGTWRSALCVASSTYHSIAYCKATIEY